MRWVRDCGLLFVLTLTLACTGAWRAGTSARDVRVVWYRLLEAEEVDSSRVEAEASPPHYAWSADEIASSWASVSGEDSVTLSSPPLELQSLDAIDRIIVSFGPEPASRVLLLWSAEPVLSHADFLRNRRELRPTAEGASVIRGKELRAHVGAAVSHLFLHLEGTADPRGALRSVAVVTLQGRLGSRSPETVRVMVDGEMRDALHLPPKTAWSKSRSYRLPEDSELLFGLHAASSARLRLDVLADGARQTLVDAWIEGSGWRDFRVALPRASVATFELQNDGDAPLFWSSPRVLAPGRSPTNRPNVVVYVVDSLRADVLGLYGGEPGTSPFLDSLADRALVYERCYAAASWTKPSVASLLSSLYPGTHRLGSLHYTDPLPDHVPTLADYFRDAGYVTAQFTANPFSGTLSNLDRGFDRYVAPDAFTSSADATHVSAAAINDRLLPWLDSHARDRFFAYVQSVDPHPPFAAIDGEALVPIEAYRAAVRSNDEAIARLYHHLEDLGIAENTLLVVTADHGEAFGEHQRSGHGQSVYEEEIRVPLILHWPEGIEKGRVDTVAHHVDLLPTALDYASIPVEGTRVEGRSLRRASASTERAPPVFVSRFVYPEDVDLEGVDRMEANAVIDFPWKLIVEESGGLELYDLSNDPAERDDRAAQHPERVSALRSELDSFLAGRAATRARLIGPSEGARIREPDAPSSNVLEHLRALGYVR